MQVSLANAVRRAKTADRIIMETKGEVQHLKEQVEELTAQAEEGERQKAAQVVQLEDVQQQFKVRMLPLFVLPILLTVGVHCQH